MEVPPPHTFGYQQGFSFLKATGGVAIVAIIADHLFPLVREMRCHSRKPFEGIKDLLIFAVLGLMETAFIQQVRRSSLIVVHGVVHQFLQISGFQHKMIPPHRLRRNLG
jgi:hypothetical protein